MKTPAIKILAAAAALFLGTTGAQATVTLLFGTTSTYASNWGDIGGGGGAKMVWGILVDTTGNGFLAANEGYSSTGLSLTAGAYQPLTNNQTDLPSDDLLFLSPALMVSVNTPTDGSVVGQNRITAISGVQLGVNGVNTGDPFAIVWFDATALSGTPIAVIRFGLFENPAFTLPPDTFTQPYTSVFTGADPLKPMNGTIAPEPSTLLLSALGALALIRRRR